MLTTERHKAIIQLLKENQTITIQDAARITGASISTIRRDFTELEKANELQRIHGGAVLPEQKQEEYSVTERSSRNLDEKIQIAGQAAGLVQHGDCIYLDAGTTTLKMIPRLHGKEITVVTNGLTHVDALIEHGMTAYITGGRIKAKTAALIGPQAVQTLQNFRFDKCFIGVNGFSAEAGYTTPDPEEAILKRTAQQLSTASFVLADHSKYRTVNFARISPMSDAVLVTGGLPEKAEKILQELTEIRRTY
ncbi:DeoR/GlpR family DNA-binding transcription regulator [Virgibacillus xinjiangensis]|uniref:DeoR/GlpR family DNA-binding transcription regulator n=1 Tax=Virgibacillus xinjiangensis TaxID=393090 RepID=A0ABV7D0B8_9BACI